MLRFELLSDQICTSCTPMTSGILASNIRAWSRLTSSGTLRREGGGVPSPTERGAWCACAPCHQHMNRLLDRAVGGHDDQDGEEVRADRVDSIPVRDTILIQPAVREGPYERRSNAHTDRLRQRQRCGWMAHATWRARHEKEARVGGCPTCTMSPITCTMAALRAIDSVAVEVSACWTARPRRQEKKSTAAACLFCRLDAATGQVALAQKKRSTAPCFFFRLDAATGQVAVAQKKKSTALVFLFQARRRHGTGRPRPEKEIDRRCVSFSGSTSRTRRRRRRCCGRCG